MLRLAHLPGLHNAVVQALGMCPGAPQPGGDGPLIHTEGHDDGLKGTAQTQQGDDDGEQVGGVVQTVERGGGRGGEGLATDGAAIALLFAGMAAER